MEETSELVLWINGRRVSVTSPDQSTNLATFLRSRGLTGTKVSCGEGSCGACTVLLTRLAGDDKVSEVAITACTTTITSLHGAHITTVEGVGSTRAGLHPVQERLYKCHGSQCGFCSPGMVMSMVGVMRTCTTPDIEDITRGIQGNLCRCTGYRPIVEAFSTFSTNQSLAVREDPNNENDCVETYDTTAFQEYVRKPFDQSLLLEMKTFASESPNIISMNSGESVWLKPHTLDDCYTLLDKYPSAIIRQGGTGGYKKFKKPSSQKTLDISGIMELKILEKNSTEIKIGSGVTFTTLRSYLATLLDNEAEDKTKMMGELLKIIDKLATEQVRNVATLGGTILWAHPASDVVPLLIVSGATMTMGNKTGTRKISVRDYYKEQDGPRPNQGEILLAINIPFCRKEEGFKFYKHARRKTADLAVANLAVSYQLHQTGRLENVEIVIGGVGTAIKQSTDIPIVFADNTSQLLTSSQLDTVTRSEICKSVEKDMKIKTMEFKQPDLMAFRVSLCVGFIEMLREEILTKKVAPNQPAMRSHQLFEIADPAQPDLDPVTRPLPHITSAEQCTGEAVYVDDIPRTVTELLLFPVQSKVAHGKIRSINTDKALSIPGVHGWISAKDVPGRNFWSIGGASDEEVFPSDAVQYVGQIVGLVAATDAAAGQKAVSLVDIEYEVLKPILTLDEAAAKDSFHASKRQLIRIQNDEKKESRTVTGSVFLGGQEHFYFEPHSALAVPTGEKEEMTVHFTTQEPCKVQTQLATVLNIPQHKIVVKCKRAGGGFGGKERCYVALMAAVAAYTMRRPCRLILTRDVDVDTSGHRHETRATYKIEYQPDGKIVRSEFNLDVNAGSSTDLSLAWVDTLIRRIDGGYTLHNFEGKGVAWNTNLVSNTAFRGFGSPEGALIIEDAIEKIANQLDLDPAVVREKNLTKEGDLLHHGTLPVNEDFLSKCWKECMEQSKYWQTKQEIELFNKENKVKKRGIAIVPTKFFPTIPFKPLNQAGAFIRIYVDGSILLSHGGAEMGQGLHTKMVQVAARVLGVCMSKIHIIDTSSETVPNATPTGGSSGTDLNGKAVINACEQLVEQLKPYRSQYPDYTWEQIVRKAYENRTQLAAFGFYNTSPLTYDSDTNQGSMFNYLTFGVGCSVVEVDCLTGEHTVLKTDIVMDVGKSLNPAIDIGQIEGAFIQGYGYVTMEELLHDKQGEVLNKNLSTYKIPTVQDIPKEFNVTLLRNSGTKEEAVFSSKGIGEPPLTLAVSVVCAIRQAVNTYRRDHGVTQTTHLEIPLTSEKIRMACEDEIVQFVKNNPKLQCKEDTFLNILE